MKRNAKKLLALLVLSGLLLLVLSGVALAGPPWSDASATWWSSNYGVTEAEVATVADGYPDGTFRPAQAVTRAQFAKMAVSGLGVSTAEPAKATFVDVIPSYQMFPYIEGAYAAGLVGGYPVGNQLYYKPTQNIQRQQANSILGRYLSQLEIDITGFIHGDVNNYGSLDLWYAAEGSFYLNAFEDAKYVGSAHRATTAYLIRRNIVKGSNSRLNPSSTLVRSQAAALILRVEAEAEAIKTPPSAPTNLAVSSTGSGVTVSFNSATQQYVGNDPTPQVTGDTLPSREIAIYDTVDGVISKALFVDSSSSAGKFYADVDPSLHTDWLTESGVPYVIADGVHQFTARVKNANGLVSAPSSPVAYLLDTVLPSASVATPAVPAGQTSVVVKVPKPGFTALVTDERSGVKQVEFQVAVKQATPVWQTVSVDTIPDSGNTIYAAVWPTSGSLAAGLSDGQYQFRVIASDNAGNQRTSAAIDVIVDSSVPTATITAPLVPSGIYYTESRRPTFTATAADSSGGAIPASGIASVTFYYATWSQSGGPTTWGGFNLISTDTTPDYAASYASDLPEGHWIFAVKATDNVGNESALMNGPSYVSGVTQEVVIDATPPVVTVTQPIAGQSFGESQVVTIAWTLTDVMPPDTVKIQYTLDGSVASPEWFDITTDTVNDGVFQWTAPDVTGDDQNVRVRIVAVDKTGEKVNDVPGHTTIAMSGLFTVYDVPLPVTSLTASDPDSTVAGVDGRDFHASWVPSVSTDIVSQKVYLLPASAGSLNLTTDHAVETFNDNTTSEWTGIETLTIDSRNGALVDGSYTIWIVVTDVSGHVAALESNPFPVAAP